MARTRIYGKGLTFEFEGVEYKCDLTSAVLTKDSADQGATDSTLTFCDVAGASTGNVWYLNISAIQSTDSVTEKSLHTLVWDTAILGGELDFTFAPHGNEDATVNEPHYTGMVVVDAGGYPDIGGDAGENAFTWDYSFVVKDNVVTKVTA